MELPTQINMYNACVPGLVRSVGNLVKILEKAKTYAAEKNISDETILGLRLVADMLPLWRQITIVSDNLKGAAARLGGVDMPKYEDNEKTIDELIARLDKTIDFVNSLDPKGFENSETKEIVLNFGPVKYEFTGYTYLTGFVLPNIYFHISIAYAILRANGVPLGKLDFLA